MSKFLSIIILHYDETVEEMFPLLSSIYNQVGVGMEEVEVILVHDAGPEESLEGLSKIRRFFHPPVEIVHMEENGGPGLARQKGIDVAKGQYVMFCDADDIFHSVAVLGVFLQELKSVQPDILASPWLEEIKTPEGQFIYITHDDEATWMHGKAIKLSYIRGNNIRFHDQLRVHEDSYFLSLAYDLTESKCKLTFPTYVWKWRPGSIVRRNGSAYTYESIPVFNRAVCLAVEEMERRGMEEKIPYKVIQLICYTYCTLQQAHWKREEVRKYRKEAEQSLVKEIAPYVQYLHQAPQEMLIEVFNQERAKHIKDSMEDELFANWLRRIGLAGQRAA